jgi:hypothetical protein
LTTLTRPDAVAAAAAAAEEEEEEEEECQRKCEASPGKPLETPGGEVGVTCDVLHLPSQPPLLKALPLHRHHHHRQQRGRGCSGFGAGDDWFGRLA